MTQNPPPLSTQTLNQLAALWQQAKSDEEAAKARRIAIELAICEKHPKPVGASTYRTTGETPSGKITIEYGITRKVHTEALQVAWSSLADQVKSCFRWKAEVDAKKFGALQDMAPQLVPVAAVFIETKDAKPSVKVGE